MAEIKTPGEGTISGQREERVTFCHFVLPIMNGGKVSSHAFILL